MAEKRSASCLVRYFDANFNVKCGNLKKAFSDSCPYLKTPKLYKAVWEDSRI